MNNKATNTSHVEQLATFLATTNERKLPVDVYNAARLCLSDWMAIAIGAGEEGAGRIVRNQVSAMASSGKARVLFGGTASPALAALANGTLAHCLDFDDTHASAGTHVSAPVWAATLALGEHIEAGEDSLLRAFVAGFEVAARVGHGLGQAVTEKGLHSTGIFGRVGAAAASAALLGLTAERAAHALAAAATQASGLTASFGTMAKPYHAGKAAMDGVLSAELAADGFIAAPRVLEPGGLDAALVQDGSAVMQPPDFSHWEILNNSFKPYAACHLTHPAIDAANALGIAPSDIVRARAKISPLAMKITGHTTGQPDSPLAAKFDIRYCTALALHGHNLAANDFREPWQLDPVIGSTAARIDTEADTRMRFESAQLEVEATDGQIHYVDIPVAKGHPGNPIDWQDMQAKFEGLVTQSCGCRTEELFNELRTFGANGRLGHVHTLLASI